MKNFNFQKSLCVSSLQGKKLFPALFNYIARNRHVIKFESFFILMSFRIEYTAVLQFHIAHITLTKYNSQFHKVYKYNVCPSNMSICVITCQSVHKICTMLYQKSIPCISIFIYIFNHPTNQIWVFYILWKKIRLFSHIMITS